MATRLRRLDLVSVELRPRSLHWAAWQVATTVRLQYSSSPQDSAKLETGITDHARARQSYRATVYIHDSDMYVYLVFRKEESLKVKNLLEFQCC